MKRKPFIALWFWLLLGGGFWPGSSFSQNAFEERQKELERLHANQQQELEKLHEKEKWLDNVENIYLEHIAKPIRKKLEKENAEFEEAELESIRRHINRHLQLKEAYKEASTESSDYLTVAILGNSQSTYDKEGFNRIILANFLGQIKKINPHAVFFAGNLINGLTLQKSQDQNYKESTEKDLMKNLLFEEEREKYDRQNFQERLDLFYALLQEFIPDIPFYPIPGQTETVSEEALLLFKNRFNLESAEIFDSRQLAYSVKLGNSFFVLISTDYFDPEKKTEIEGMILPQEFKWLSVKLLKNKGSSQFSFVIGNDPAFSTKGSFGVYEGLDKNEKERNLFWSILREGGVRAYFAGKEALFDRTYRYGIWQIIAGGSGAIPDSTWDETEIFYHFLLLKIPQSGSGDPIVEVYDRLGRKRDVFKLGKNPFPIYQMQISKEIYPHIPEAKMDEVINKP